MSRVLPTQPKRPARGGHTGLIVTSAALAGGGVAAWQVVEKLKGEEESGCALSFSRPQFTVPAAGGVFTFEFEENCTWIASSDQPWLTLTGQTSGVRSRPFASGLAKVALPFSVQPNPSPTARVANITVAEPDDRQSNISVSITQSGSAGTFSLRSGVVVSSATDCKTPFSVDRMVLSVGAQRRDGWLTAAASPGCGVLTTYSVVSMLVTGSEVFAKLRIRSECVTRDRVQGHRSDHSAELRGTLTFANSAQAQLILVLSP